MFKYYLVFLRLCPSKQFKLAKGRDIVGIMNRIKDAVVDESGKAIARDITEMAYSL